MRRIRLPACHDAEAVRDGLMAVLASLPETARNTLTWDQGCEMAFHDQVAPLLREGVFFAHPASPWQRATNENTNGLLRQYSPKRTELSIHTAADLRAVEERLNNRPRKTLGWRTSSEIFAAALTSRRDQRCDDRSNPPTPLFRSGTRQMYRQREVVLGGSGLLRRMSAMPAIFSVARPLMHMFHDSSDMCRREAPVMRAEIRDRRPAGGQPRENQRIMAGRHDQKVLAPGRRAADRQNSPSGAGFSCLPSEQACQPDQPALSPAATRKLSA